MFHSFLMPHSKAKLKRNSDKASSFFKPFSTGKALARILPIRTLLYVSFKHDLISLTRLTIIPH
jgi:hypothetical protein